MPVDRAVFENVPPTILQPKYAWCVLFGGVWRKPVEILRGEGKARVMLVGPLSVCGNGHRSCWTTRPWYWVLQRAAVVLQTSNTLLARSVSSLLPRSPTLSADGSRLKVIPPTSHLVQCYRPRMHSDVDQCGTAASASTPDSELFTVLSAEAVRVAGEEAQNSKAFAGTLPRWRCRPE